MKYFKILHLFISLFFCSSCKEQNEKNKISKSHSIEFQIPKELKIINEENINIDGDSSLEKIITATDSTKGTTREFWYKNGKLVYEFGYASTSINKKWLVNLINDEKKEIVRAQGDEDGIDYTIFEIQNHKQLPILYFNPVIQDKKNTEIFFWGYPWDMDEMTINNEIKVLVSLNNSYIRDGNFIQPDFQSELPFILFSGKTTQPDIFITPLNKPKFYSLKELIKTLSKKNITNTLTAFNWNGKYEGTFLRLKGETADPRAWGKISLEIKDKNANFNLDTYNEIVEKKFLVLDISANELKLVDKATNKFLKLNKEAGKIFIQGNLMESIVGEKEIYEIKKNFE